MGLRVTPELMRPLDVQVHPRVQPPADFVRDKVRDGTKKKVQDELGLKRFGDPASISRLLPLSQHLRLFAESRQVLLDAGTNARRGQESLFGRYDVLAVPARRDFDSKWAFRKDQQSKNFLVLHAAGLNLGESRESAADFRDFCKRAYDGRVVQPAELDEAACLRSFGFIFENLMEAASQCRVQQLVWFPFGMGAFLRHLGLLDARYQGNPASNRCSLDLRRGIAGKFVEVLLQSRRPFRVHICLGPTEEGGEADANTDAYVLALQRAGPQLLPGLVTLHLHADALDLAADFAETGQLTALVNGANRALLGNHWFERGARQAIDENLHRRSWFLAAYAYLLNCMGEKTCEPLEDRVKALGGQVVPIPPEPAWRPTPGFARPLGR